MFSSDVGSPTIVPNETALKQLHAYFDIQYFQQGDGPVIESEISSPDKIAS